MQVDKEDWEEILALAKKLRSMRGPIRKLFDLAHQLKCKIEIMDIESSGKESREEND